MSEENITRVVADLQKAIFELENVSCSEILFLEEEVKESLDKLEFINKCIRDARVREDGC